MQPFQPDKPLETEGGSVAVRAFGHALDHATRVLWFAEGGHKAEEYVPVVMRGHPDLRVVVSGLAVRGDELAATHVRHGDEVIVYIAPQDPVTFLISLGISLAMTGISMGISYAMGPAANQNQGLEESPTYGFDGMVNTVRPGTSIPIIYGTHRHAGHIVGQFTRQVRNPPDGYTDQRAGELHTLIALCTGPIEQVSDLEINENPASDFGETVRWLGNVRLGELHQTAVDGFREVVTPRYKNASLLYGDSERLTFTTDDTCDGYEIQFRFGSGLADFGDSGEMRQTSVQFRIEYREYGTSEEFQEAGVHIVSRATRSPFDSWFRSEILSRAKYEIRVTRQTFDAPAANVSSGSEVYAINEILDVTPTYPKIALVGVKQLPTNLVSGAPPSYTSLVKGKLVYTWDVSGTKSATRAWSDNPAWCLADLLTDPFDGVGAWVSESQLDLSAFYAWSVFCAANDLTLNIVLDGSLTAIDAIKQIATVGMADFYLAGDKWTVRPQQAEEPVQLFQMSRIHKDSFSVAKKTKMERANSFTGQFWNEERDYEQDAIVLEDPTLLEGEAQREHTVNLLGATSAKQVERILTYFMLANRLSRREITFEVGVDALACEAGDVVKIAHDVPGWGFSGKILRVLDDTGTLLVLDREVTIAAGTNYELTVIQPDDTIDVVEVTAPEGTSARITVSGDWSTIPTAGADYSFGEVGQSTALYRITSITRSSKPTKRVVRAAEYDSRIFDEDVTVLPQPSPSRLPSPHRIPADVRDLRLNEREVYAEDGTLSLAIDVHFTLPAEAGARAQVFWREEDAGAWIAAAPPIDVGYFSLRDNIRAPGYTYEISVVSVSETGNRKAPALGVRATITTSGTTRQPDNVLGFTVNRSTEGLIFQWTPIDPIKNFDLDYYEVRDGGTWDAALLVGRTTDHRLTTSAFRKGTRTFQVKAFNTAGKSSAAAAVVVITVEERIGENVIFSRTEHTTWTGAREGFTINGSDELELTTTAEIVAWRAGLRSAPLRSQLLAGGYGQQFRLTAAYTTAKFEVSSDAVRCLISTDIEIDQVDTTMIWSALTDKTWAGEFARTRTWGVAPNGRVQTKLEMRFSTTDDAESAFGPWEERPENIEALVAWAQARVTVTVLDPTYSVIVREMTINFDVPDIRDSDTIDTVGTGTVAVAFNQDFHVVPKIAATVIPATAGDEVFISDKTKDGFNLAVKNGGSFVVRSVDYVAIGY